MDLSAIPNSDGIPKRLFPSAVTNRRSLATPQRSQPAPALHPTPASDAITMLPNLTLSDTAARLDMPQKPSSDSRGGGLRGSGPRRAPNSGGPTTVPTAPNLESTDDWNPSPSQPRQQQQPQRGTPPTLTPQTAAGVGHTEHPARAEAPREPSPSPPASRSNSPGAVEAVSRDPSPPLMPIAAGDDAAPSSVEAQNKEDEAPLPNEVQFAEVIELEEEEEEDSDSVLGGEDCTPVTKHSGERPVVGVMDSDDDERFHSCSSSPPQRSMIVPPFGEPGHLAALTTSGGTPMKEAVTPRSAPVGTVVSPGRPPLYTPPSCRPNPQQRTSSSPTDPSQRPSVSASSPTDSDDEPRLPRMAPSIPFSVSKWEVVSNSSPNDRSLSFSPPPPAPAHQPAADHGHTEGAGPNAAADYLVEDVCLLSEDTPTPSLQDLPSALEKKGDPTKSDGRPVEPRLDRDASRSPGQPPAVLDTTPSRSEHHHHHYQEEDTTSLSFESSTCSFDGGVPAHASDVEEGEEDSSPFRCNALPIVPIEEENDREGGTEVAPPTASPTKQKALLPALTGHSPAPLNPDPHSPAQRPLAAPALSSQDPHSPAQRPLAAPALSTQDPHSPAQRPPAAPALSSQDPHSPKPTVSVGTPKAVVRTPSAQRTHNAASGSSHNEGDGFEFVGGVDYEELQRSELRFQRLDQQQQQEHLDALLDIGGLSFSADRGQPSSRTVAAAESSPFAPRAPDSPAVSELTSSDDDDEDDTDADGPSAKTRRQKEPPRRLVLPHVPALSDGPLSQRPSMVVGGVAPSPSIVEDPLAAVPLQATSRALPPSSHPPPEAHRSLVDLLLDDVAFGKRPTLFVAPSQEEATDNEAVLESRASLPYGRMIFPRAVVIPSTSSSEGTLSHSGATTTTTKAQNPSETKLQSPQPAVHADSDAAATASAAPSTSSRGYYDIVEVDPEVIDAEWKQMLRGKKTTLHNADGSSSGAAAGSSSAVVPSSWEKAFFAGKPLVVSAKKGFHVDAPVAKGDDPQQQQPKASSTSRSGPSQEQQHLHPQQRDRFPSSSSLRSISGGEKKRSPLLPPPSDKRNEKDEVATQRIHINHPIAGASSSAVSAQSHKPAPNTNSSNAATKKLSSPVDDMDTKRYFVPSDDENQNNNRSNSGGALQKDRENRSVIFLPEDVIRANREQAARDLLRREAVSNALRDIERYHDEKRVKERYNALFHPQESTNHENPNPPRSTSAVRSPPPPLFSATTNAGGTDPVNRGEPFSNQTLPSSSSSPNKKRVSTTNANDHPLERAVDPSDEKQFVDDLLRVVQGLRSASVNSRSASAAVASMAGKKLTSPPVLE